MPMDFFKDAHSTRGAAEMIMWFERNSFDTALLWGPLSQNQFCSIYDYTLRIKYTLYFPAALSSS